MRVCPGSSYPLGATWDGSGVNFALFSENAEKVELCLFDSISSTTERERVLLPECTDQVWHGYFPSVGLGQLYGFRVYGPYAPEIGQRFNPNKLLLDPYAKSIARSLNWGTELFGYDLSSKDGDLSFSVTDSAARAPLAAVVDSNFDWAGDVPPRTPWHKTIIYETHVKGLTMLHPDVPPELRGTYAGVASPAIIKHLQMLGVTAIELMPIHQFISERDLVQKGLTNYWGYNTLCYFAPELSLSTNKDPLAVVLEFKSMVRALHAAGIEVILDVVYNHTAEGSHNGPTLSFRGIDNAAYYRLNTHSPRKYIDFTGCGNTLNMQHPRVLQLIMDSLRYWICEMHVDGFRFDLASALARELHDVDRLGSFFDIIHQDPIISRAKLIAEPWDLGEGGYQVGNFPVLWTEWNGQYRDSVRSFWRQDLHTIGNMATRISGSSDLYNHSGRRPYASINFVTCHDGFTLTDLVSFEQKHNLANLENNQDGNNNNLSWNCGVEGPTTDESINILRRRQKRNLLATLFFSAGVPMLLGGDELGRTQQGNNNAYCQDNELSWYNWNLSEADRQFLYFVSKLIRLRKTHPVFERRKFFTGLKSNISRVPDICWINELGEEMSTVEWKDPHRQVIGVLLSGKSIDELDEFGQRCLGDTILILLNASDEDKKFTLPNPFLEESGHWQLLLDTLQETVESNSAVVCLEPSHRLAASSLAVFRWSVSCKS